MIQSDWEGPWVIADHAFEVTKRGIPNGGKLFSIISEYDDYLAYVKKKVGYEPGDTLALIAPFLIAHDLNSNFLIKVAKDNANFIDGALKAISIITEMGYPLRIISTSYCQYVYETASIAGISNVHVKCTYFDIDKYINKVNKNDKKFLRKKAQEIAKYPPLGISATVTEKELSETALEAIHALDNLFWEELPKTSFREVLDTVKPLGGFRKYQALLDFLKEEKKELQECEAIGDSITDWVMLMKTKEAGGLAISFNGNEYAIRNSNIAVISETCLITPIVIDVFRKKGLSAVEELARNWTYKRLKKAAMENWLDPLLFETLMHSISQKSKKTFPLAVWITDENLGEIIRRSMQMRKTVRGATVGSLG